MYREKLGKNKIQNRKNSMPDNLIKTPIFI
jgi:hypothetical protein